MELTAKTLQEVTFGAKVRGYDPAEVDDFIAAVAEGVDELQERLRRATERATKAEQQLAAMAAGESSAPQADVVAPVAAAPVGGSAEISKVWERAVAAAEQAMEEAKAEAQRLLDEARTRADTQLNDARHEAETTVSTAQAEATRISEESQRQLRIEITQLEGLRDQLNTDAAGIAEFLAAEKEKLRSRIADALTAIDAYGSGAGPLEEVSKSPLSEAATSAASATTESWAAPAATSNSADAPAWPSPSEAVDSFMSPEPEPQPDDEGAVDAATAPDAGTSEWPTSGEPTAQWGSWPQESTDEGETAATKAGESGSGTDDWPAENQAESTGDNASEDEDQDADPFLAELRRAVQDDGPLGPREDNGDDSSIQDLYSDDDDDRNGFFRRKK